MKCLQTVKFLLVALLKSRILYRKIIIMVMLTIGVLRKKKFALLTQSPEDHILIQGQYSLITQVIPHRSPHRRPSLSLLHHTGRFDSSRWYCYDEWSTIRIGRWRRWTMRLLLDDAKGLEPQTRKLFEVCRMKGLPLFTLVNRIWVTKMKPL